MVLLPRPPALLVAFAVLCLNLLLLFVWWYIIIIVLFKIDIDRDVSVWMNRFSHVRQLGVHQACFSCNHGIHYTHAESSYISVTVDE